MDGRVGPAHGDSLKLQKPRKLQYRRGSCESAFGSAVQANFSRLLRCPCIGILRQAQDEDVFALLMVSLSNHEAAVNVIRERALP
jgi:hypothetical protein